MERIVCERRRWPERKEWICLNRQEKCKHNKNRLDCHHPDPEDNWPLEKKCGVCGEPQSYHYDDVMPGDVFIDGMGIVTCEEAKGG